MPPVRETRHLWVGNIPDGTTEEKLIEYFQRYGRIDSVKILTKRSLDGGQAAFVDFVDIRCAIKAHETPNRVGDRELRTDYNEPASSTLTRSQGETGRRYDRGGRGFLLGTLVSSCSNTGPMRVGPYWTTEDNSLNMTDKVIQYK